MGETRGKKMYEAILTSEPEFPPAPPKEGKDPSIAKEDYKWTKDIITKLLEKKAHKRLGSGAKGVEEIKQHPFFKKHLKDWKKMYEQKKQPAWKANLKSGKDLSNFDRFPSIDDDTDEQLLDDIDGSIFAWADEF